MFLRVSDYTEIVTGINSYKLNLLLLHFDTEMTIIPYKKYYLNFHIKKNNKI